MTARCGVTIHTHMFCSIGDVLRLATIQLGCYCHQRISDKFLS